jgi:hypothetical protein
MVVGQTARYKKKMKPVNAHNLQESTPYIVITTEKSTVLPPLLPLSTTTT